MINPDLITRLSGTARTSAVNSYRKAPAPADNSDKATKSDTVELSAEAKQLHASNAVTSELEKAVTDKVNSLRNSIANGSYQISSQDLDAISERVMAAI